MILYAPAKVNLYLRVKGKRKDGYHNIETIFEKIALFDKIILRSLPLRRTRQGGGSNIKVFSDHPGVPAGKTGLIYRTIKLLKQKFRIPEGVEARIIKKIPVASGLGGGSTDAAAILMGLNRLWKLSLTVSRLAEIGKDLGADVPFFLNKNSFALARGIGEKITPLGWRTRFWHLLINPPAKLLSKNIYQAYDRSCCSGLTKKPHATKILLPNRIPAGFENIKKFAGNDLERVVLKRKPVVSRIKNALDDVRITHSLVSGSGPSVFSLFKKRKEAMQGKKLLIRHFPFVMNKGWQLFIVPTL